MTAEININTNRLWRCTDHGAYVAYHVGNNIDDHKIYRHFSQSTDIDLALKEILCAMHGNYAHIIETTDYIFAFVDRVRGYPLYYYHRGNKFLIAEHPDALLSAVPTMEIDDDNLLIFLMSGYVHNNGTWYQHLKQLQAGDCLWWHKNSHQLKIVRYYDYLPCPCDMKSEADLLAEHDVIMNRITTRMIEQANGNPIWVALSGGLDSRLVLAKLKQFNYDNLQAFSYGVAHNFEAKTAKWVAQQLGVKWQFIPAKPATAQQLFSSEVRKKYTHYAFAYSAIPSYMDFEAIYRMTQKGYLNENCVIVNGQSGDYLTGGHIPKRLLQNPCEPEMMMAIVDKHGSLWTQLKTEKTLNLLREKILLTKPHHTPYANPKEYYCAWYENWEWQERQTKAVVNGQRTYDYFNLRWLLPLWDNELLDYWRTVPIQQKIDQRLFVKYLTQYNYKNVFSRLRDPAHIWAPKYRWIPLCARLVGLLMGDANKHRYYKRMYYFSKDINQYAFLGRQFYLQNYHHTRSFVSLAVLHLVSEFNISQSWIGKVTS